LYPARLPGREVLLMILRSTSPLLREIMIASYICIASSALQCWSARSVQGIHCRFERKQHLQSVVQLLMFE
jgi:hypothetical protein